MTLAAPVPAADAQDNERTEEVGVDGAARLLRDHPRVVRLGRVGWVAKGVVYALTGILALLIAFDPFGHGAGDEASQSGAIATIAQQPAGAMLLTVVAVGLVVYSSWRIVSTLLPADNDVETWLTRAGYLVSAGTYLVLAWSAMSFARNPGDSSGSEDSTVNGLTRSLLEFSGGRWLVGAVGVAVMAVGAYFFRKGVAATFESQLEPGGVGRVSHQTLIHMGRIGWIGRAAMMALIGFFLTRAAVLFDHHEAQGLDGSLRKVVHTSLGTALALAVGAGLIVYGVFCVLSAPRRRLVSADD